MTIFFGLAFAVLLVLALGGDLSKLLKVDLRGKPAVLGAFALQLMVVTIAPLDVLAPRGVGYPPRVVRARDRVPLRQPASAEPLDRGARRCVQLRGDRRERRHHARVAYRASRRPVSTRRPGSTTRRRSHTRGSRSSATCSRSRAGSRCRTCSVSATCCCCSARPRCSPASAVCRGGRRSIACSRVVGPGAARRGARHTTSRAELAPRTAVPRAPSRPWYAIRCVYATDGIPAGCRRARECVIGATTARAALPLRRGAHDPMGTLGDPCGSA